MRDQAFDYFQSRGTGEYGAAWLELADFELYLVFFRFTHVWRIGYYEIKPAGSETLQEVGLVKVNPIFELMAGYVDAGDFECSSGNVRGVDFGLGKCFG